MKTLLCNADTDLKLGQCFDQVKAQIGNPDAVEIVSQLLGVSFTELHTDRERLISHSEIERLNAAIQRRLSGEPVAYILGCKAFRNLNIKVSPDVLIPRFETELLVEVVLEITPGSGRVLDLGTGSGAIAIAISDVSQLQVIAVDNDSRALQMCKENCRQLGVAVEIVQSNWFENVTGYFDTIVSNPPYIAIDDPHLLEGDLRFEPQNALVSGDDGSEQLEEIIDTAMKFLNPNGWLVVEHGHDQHDRVRRFFTSRGYAQIQQRTDYFGTPRIMWGQSHGR